MLVPHTALVVTLDGPSGAGEGIVKAVPRRMLVGAVSLNVGLVETITPEVLFTTSIVKVQAPV